MAADPAFGLKIRPAAILRNLLQQYPSGGQFFSEALQNADDTGRAGKFCALLDLRKHPTQRLRPPEATRASLQGEAIVFYDDAGFAERDWRSLQYMCDSEKRQTPYDAGAFGMGSRSYFHITDVLQILSHNKLSALDPDDILESGHFGEQVDFTKDKWLDTNPDEGSPFVGLFGCDMRTPFKGTIIRAPLRTTERAAACSFMPTEFDVGRAERIFKEFEETLRNGEVLLFLNGIKLVELYRWSPGSATPDLVVSAKLGVSSGHGVPANMSPPRCLRTFLEQFSTFPELEAGLRSKSASPPKILEVIDMETTFASRSEVTSSRWLRFGNFYTDEEAVTLGLSCNCVPNVTIALPVSHIAFGSLFTSLPLPLLTGLPVHINAHFRLHANRRDIWRKSADLEGEHALWAKWNELVFAKLAPKVYAEALQWMANATDLVPKHGQGAWPDPANAERGYEVILDSLVRFLVDMPVLPLATGELVKPKDAVHFPSPTAALQAVRGQVIDLCIKGGWKSVDPPEYIVKLLQDRKALTMKSCKWSLVDVLIPACPGLSEEPRAILLLAFLEWAATWPENEIKELGKKLASVPWVPNEDGQVRAINDSFDPEQCPDALLVVQQRRATIDALVTSANVKADAIWRVFRTCGLKREITWEDAMEEAQGIVSTKDVQRSVNLYTHMDKRHTHFTGKRSVAIKWFQENPWLPATSPNKVPSERKATQLLGLKDMFPASQYKTVWAVAPALASETEPSITELKAARHVDKEPEMLVQQVQSLMKWPVSPAQGEEAEAKFVATRDHLRVVFPALVQSRVLKDIVLPAIQGLNEKDITCFLLTFIDWAGSWKEGDVKELGKLLASVEWLYVVDGSRQSIGNCFDPEKSPECFDVVRKRRAKMDSFISEAAATAAEVWRVLRLAGMKKEITWEDAVEEAESIVQNNGLARAGQLFAHIDRHHAQLRGGRVASLKQLQALAWVPVVEPGIDPDATAATKLLALPAIFPPSERKLVWAVAPSLCLEAEPTLQELKAGRTVKSEASILVEQIHALAVAAGKDDAEPVKMVKHFTAAFGVLPATRVFPEIVSPAIEKGLAEKQLAVLLLILLEWANSWKDTEIKELGRKLSGMKWVPVADGPARAIDDCFDPAESPEAFAVVQKRRAKIDVLVTGTGSSSAVILRIFRLCGMKRQISWEDAVEEAESIVSDGSIARASQLFAHVDKNHASFGGNRTACLEKVRGMKWAPGIEPSKDPDNKEATKLFALADLYPPSARKLVWAVAPTLGAEVDPTLHELRPARNVTTETNILVEQVCVVASSAKDAGSTKAALEHLRAVFRALAPTRVLAEVVLPATAKLSEAMLPTLLLAFLEWAGSWKQPEIEELGRKLSDIKWIPGEDGTVRAIADCFDPERSPTDFSVVRAKQAKMDALFEASGVTPEIVWRVLRLCGMKAEITWDDAVDEATSIIQGADIPRASKLLAHLNAKHKALKGGREVSLERLQELEWLPATEPSTDAEATSATKLMSLKSLFAPSARQLVWAVAPCLFADAEPMLHELKPRRTVDAEPQMLVEQVRTLSGSIAEGNEAAKNTPASIYKHLRAVFGALAPAQSLTDVLLPVATGLKGKRLTTLLLIYIEWADSWRESDQAILGAKLNAIKWIGANDGSLHPVNECFDPQQSPAEFGVVKNKTAQLLPEIEHADVKASTVWRVLRICGLKKEITWEDAVLEAKSIASEGDCARSSRLFAYLDTKHAQLSGNRANALEELQRLAWVPAAEPSPTPEKPTATKLLSLPELYPPSARKLVWAVAPSLAMDAEPALRDLKPQQKVDSDLGVLVKQAKVLATSDKLTAAVASEHLRALFGCLEPARIVADVVLPVSTDLADASLGKFVLFFMEWLGSRKESEVREHGKKLSDIEWIPVESGDVRSMGDVFDPEKSPADFEVVRDRRAKLAPSITETGVDAETIWRVLRLSGVKQEISWEDAVEEADTIVQSQDIARATALLRHLDKKHAEMAGQRASSLEKLQTLAWAPAVDASPENDKAEPARLMSLKELYPPAAKKVVWAVAPSLAFDSEPKLHELRPGLSIKEDPEILVDQVKVLIDSISQEGKQPMFAPAATIDHLKAAYAELLSHLSTLPPLNEHPKLLGLPFVPCLPADPGAVGADLYEPRRATWHAKHDHRALSPAFGIVNPSDYTIRMIAEAASVAKELRSEVLAEVIESQCASTPDLAVTLTIELAARLRLGDERPGVIKVPTSAGGIELVSQVYIDDASWKADNDITVLHPRISTEDGRLLGCTSMRAEMARQCEDGMDPEAVPKGPAAMQDDDEFGQEADLVAQVKQLLQEYGDSADLVKEFVQNSDDAGAQRVAFYLQDNTFKSERVVDPRTSALQGPALYICATNPLTANDIQRMQRVGHSMKRMDFSSSGRFGVGLNVMYRYCDCPQLMANSTLHFFDLTQSYVAQPGMKRGRKFTTEKLNKHFPDSFDPFNSSDIPEDLRNFPTIFRLALRSERSDLGLKMDILSVLDELKNAAEVADRMLLFTRHLTQLEFWSGGELLSLHSVDVPEKQKYDDYFTNMPMNPLDLKVGSWYAMQIVKNIRTKTQDNEETGEWHIMHRLGIPDEAMRKVLMDELDKPHGAALLPHGAAAVKIKPFDENLRTGRICVGLPTPIKTNSAAYVHGSFALLSSRKTLPLPEESEKDPGLDKQWNKMLLDGPIAECLHRLILHCTTLQMWVGLQLEHYLTIFPLRGDRLQEILASATMKKALKSVVFPVLRGSKISWVNNPTFFNDELTAELQRQLVDDGLKIVTLPDELMLEYTDALGAEGKKLSHEELGNFLKDVWSKLHKDKTVEVALDEAVMDSLSTKENIVSMLGFMAKGLWTAHHAKHKSNSNRLHNFSLDGLEDMPLCLTHAEEVTTFRDGSVKYSTLRNILPTRKSAFIDREAHNAIKDCVDTTLAGICKEVYMEVPYIRAFTVHDLVEHRAYLEKAVHPSLGYLAEENEVLRQFWSLIAEAALTNEREAKLAAGGRVAITEDGPEQDDAWYLLVEDWAMLPVCNCDGEGDEGENLIPINQAHDVVAVTILDNDAQRAQSLTGILQICGVTTLQADLVADERIMRILRAKMVSTHQGLLHILLKQADIDELTSAQRHELLVYFSLLSVKGGVDLKDVGQLPLFKTASADGGFIALIKDNIVPCCIDPNDKHAKELSKIVPKGMSLFAWPSQQVKPIYEYCGINFCSGEDLMVGYIIPTLPSICGSDSDGTESAPLLAMLHKYVCVDRSETVKKAAMECAFVPSADFSAVGTASEFISTLTGAAEVFSSVLASFVPVWWMQQSDEHMMLLASLGMGSQLTPPMIVLCASHLDRTFGSSAPGGVTYHRVKSTDAEAPPAEEDEEDDDEEEEEKPAEAAEDDAGDGDGDGDILGMLSSGSGEFSSIWDLFGGSAKRPGTAKKKKKAKRARTEETERAVVEMSGPVTHEMLQMSFELMEEFARVASEVFAQLTNPMAAAKNRFAMIQDVEETHNYRQDLQALKEAAEMRILIVRKCNDLHAKEEADARNNMRRGAARTELQSGLQYSDISLAPLKGACFGTAKQLLWSVAPVEDHFGNAFAKTSKHLKTVLQNFGEEMYKNFGCWIEGEQTPVDLVLKHLSAMCTLMESEPAIACVKPGCVMHDDIKTCWNYLADKSDFDTPEAMEALDELRRKPCVPVGSEDVADRPADQLLLTLPKYSFFQLPILRGKEANLRQYLRQVYCDGNREATVFRMLGAADKPGALDYALASERVAERARLLGRPGWEWVVGCLEACLKGVQEEYFHTQGDFSVENLHTFTLDGEVECVSTLVWADVPRWLSRCSGEKSLRFCAINGDDQRELAKCLTDVAGLKLLSELVEERRIIEARAPDQKVNVGSHSLTQTVMKLVQSYEFANGLRACILRSHDQNQQSVDQSLAEMRQELRKVQFRPATTRLRSGLFWKKSASGSLATEALITNSELDQQVYFDEDERAVYVGTGCTDEQDDGFIAELVFSLRRALPLLWSVDSFLLEALIRCALREGPSSISSFLEKRDIKVMSVRALGPGDPVPDDLLDHVVWDVEAVFGEGECAAILTSDTFTIVEVAKWPSSSESRGTGLTKSYCVRTAPDKWETRKQFEMYKVQSSIEVEERKAQPQTSKELVPMDEVKDVDDAPTSTGDSDAKVIADVKKYLHEMANMDPDEYKAVMRRLFKQWHPDKVGDTPVSNFIFRLLRRHEQWYKKTQAGENIGDDSWIDTEDIAQEATSSSADFGKPTSDMLALQNHADGEAPEEAPTSWFDEFHNEEANKKKPMEKPLSKEEAEAAAARFGIKIADKEANREEMDRAQQEELLAKAEAGPNRIVDRQQAPRWMQQGRLEVTAAKKLMEANDALRTLPSAAVWHCEQAVEMFIKAAMFRTCGVSEDESMGGAAHDITEFVTRLKNAEARTEEQRRSQVVPVDVEEVEWLKRAYLNARYPKAGQYKIPAELYDKADADGALRLAEVFLKWATDVEDLPDPGGGEDIQCQAFDQKIQDIRKQRWANLLGSAENKGGAQMPNQQWSGGRDARAPKFSKVDSGDVSSGRAQWPQSGGSQSWGGSSGGRPMMSPGVKASGPPPRSSSSDGTPMQPRSKAGSSSGPYPYQTMGKPKAFSPGGF